MHQFAKHCSATNSAGVITLGTGHFDGTPGYRLLATIFQRAFPDPHTGCGCRRHNNLVLALQRYPAEPPIDKCAGHVCM